MKKKQQQTNYSITNNNTAFYFNIHSILRNRNLRFHQSYSNTFLYFIFSSNFLTRIVWLWHTHTQIGLLAPVPGMVAPGMNGLMLPGPPMMPMIPRFRWSAQGPLYITAARANHFTTANPTAVQTAIAPISVIYTQFQPQSTTQIIKQLQL